MELHGLELSDTLEKIKKGNIVTRIFQHDPLVWTETKEDHFEIEHRLGWLDAPKKNLGLVPEIEQLLKDCQDEGFTHVLVLGMGGSSLAPEVFSNIFGPREQFGKPGLHLSILDSTHPNQIKSSAKSNPFGKTIFVVSSKSGTTSETMSLFEYFWDQLFQKFGDKTGKNFVAVTDPGTSLETLAREKGFRKIFNGDPDVGGRYSALTAFGLVPAGLAGIDLKKLLETTGAFAEKCSPEADFSTNPGLELGVVLGTAALAGKDKLTFITDPELDSFGSWAEQLIAESSGKIGKGIVPVDIESGTKLEDYSSDRFFVYISKRDIFKPRIKKLNEAGFATYTIKITDEYDLGAEFYRWEFATAVACSVIGVNAFDQPNVQESKSLTKELLQKYNQSGKLPLPEIVWENNFGSISTSAELKLDELKSLAEIVDCFIQQAEENDYIAINAFVARNGKKLNKLQTFRGYLIEKTKCAVTLGFGPRFLHSTGQLHKGGPGKCLFIQITDNPESDLKIPQKEYSFKTLFKAQAFGDYRALVSKSRKVLLVNLKEADIFDLSL